MNGMNFKGTGSFGGGEYGDIIIEGVCTCNGDIKAESILIDGVFKGNGCVEAQSLKCDGVAEIKANIKAKKIDTDGVIRVKNGNRIEATEINCDGVIEIKGEISADIINADGFISAYEIVGDQITVKSRVNKFMQLFNPRFQSQIKFIEATNIHLQGVVANVVNGKDVVIGKDCKIEKLDCSGTLYVDKNSVVKEITGNYTLRKERNSES